MANANTFRSDLEVDLNWGPGILDVGRLEIFHPYGALEATLAERAVLAKREREDLPRFASCIQKASGPVAFIRYLHVKTGKRSRGIGSAMLQKALQVMRENGISQAFVLASADEGWQEDLEKFYRENGFRMLAQRCRDNSLSFMGITLRT